jgi:hypothetical protein
LSHSPSPKDFCFILWFLEIGSFSCLCVVLGFELRTLCLLGTLLLVPHPQLKTRYCHTAQAGLELECWDCRCVPPHPAG